MGETIWGLSLDRLYRGCIKQAGIGWICVFELLVSSCFKTLGPQGLRLIDCGR